MAPNDEVSRKDYVTLNRSVEGGLSGIKNKDFLPETKKQQEVSCLHYFPVTLLDY